MDLTSEYKNPISLALGFFDCLHVGHRALIRSMISNARQLGAESAVVTFKNDIGQYFGAEKQIYSFEERLILLEEMGVDNVIAIDLDDRMRSLSAEEFFALITDGFFVKSAFVGEDYTFGRGAEGDVALLKKLCATQNIALHIVPFETRFGEKVATSRIKQLVKKGDASSLRELLESPYIISGRISSNRRVGRSLGFPTANISVSSDKLALGDGVYATTIEVDGIWRKSMTNIGAKPTFGDGAPTIETYIFDFDADIYGKEALLRVYERTRDVKKFDSAEQLRSQLSCDEAHIRALFGKLSL